MDKKTKDTVSDYLEKILVKYSQGLIFWQKESNCINNTPERAKLCNTNIVRYSFMYNEINNLLDEL